MNNHDKHLLEAVFIIAVLTGTLGAFSLDYMNYKENLRGEYQEYMQNIMEGGFEVSIPITKEQFEAIEKNEGAYTFYYFRVGKSFEEWKSAYHKSYWEHLKKVFAMNVVSAEKTYDTKKEIYELKDKSECGILNFKYIKIDIKDYSFIDYEKFVNMNKFALEWRSQHEEWPPILVPHRWTTYYQKCQYQYYNYICAFG